MKIGGHSIPTTLPWRDNYQPVEDLVREVEERLASIESLTGQRALMREFAERYLELIVSITGTPFPVAVILSECDHKTAYRLWQEVAGFA